MINEDVCFRATSIDYGYRRWTALLIPDSLTLYIAFSNVAIPTNYIQKYGESNEIFN